MSPRPALNRISNDVWAVLLALTAALLIRIGLITVVSW
jgi:hypothetical protein